MSTSSISQSHFAAPTNATQLNFSNKEIELGRSIVELKRRFEEIARDWTTRSLNERERLKVLNLDPQIETTTGKLVCAFMPDDFLFATLGLGGWGHASYESQNRQLVGVNPWLVAGGFRKKKWFHMDHHEFQSFVPTLDADTKIGKRESGSFTNWLKPLPLLWASEGKNRIQLYQDTNTDLFTSAGVCKFIPANSLRLYKSVVNSNVWLLRYVGGIDQSWDGRIHRLASKDGQEIERVVLPFPEVAVPLLQHYGVKVDRAWGWPWRLTKGSQIQESKRVRSSGW